MLPGLSFSQVNVSSIRCILTHHYWIIVLLKQNTGIIMKFNIDWSKTSQSVLCDIRQLPGLFVYIFSPAIFEHSLVRAGFHEDLQYNYCTFNTS